MKEYKEGGGYLSLFISVVMLVVIFFGDPTMQQEITAYVVGFGSLILYKLERISNGLKSYFNGE